MGVGATHSVYLLGIPLRIAQSKKINCFSISGFNGDLVNLVNSISYQKKINGTDIHHIHSIKIFFQNFQINNKQKICYLEKKSWKVICWEKQNFFT